MFAIEPARHGDVPDLVRLLAQLFSIEQDFAVDTGRQQRGLELLIARSPQHAAVMVARDDRGRAVAMASGQLVISTAEGAPSAWIEDVVVAPEYRHRGIGRALLQSLLAWAAAHGATRAQLLADQSNEPALAFYARLGWSRSRMVMLRRTQLS
jgi:GNAT superfamily N-acetyltransferase